MPFLFEWVTLSATTGSQDLENTVERLPLEQFTKYTKHIRIKAPCPTNLNTRCFHHGALQHILNAIPDNSIEDNVSEIYVG